MKASLAIEILRQALQSPVQSWLAYSPQHVPLVVYDEDDFFFLNHPNPPTMRPDQLTAATAIDINGVLTATIPATMAADEQTLVPLAYHECFHVYQGTAFHFTSDYHFFAVLAFYPELNPAYRALCAAETAALTNRTLSLLEQATALAALTRQRHAILSQQQGLLSFEKNLERNEGVASFVEQKARKQLYNLSPDNSACRYGYARQYFVGAALCWLLEGLHPADGWQESIQNGKALSALLIETTASQTVDLAWLELARREQEEWLVAEQIRANAERQIDALLQNGVIKLQLPSNVQVSRSFSPRSIISLGDGRLIHPEFVVIQLPHGRIAIQGEMVLEDYTKGLVIFRTVPHQVIDNQLEINTEAIQVSLANVTMTPEQVIEVL